jgi:hypothetical protein
LCALIVEVVPTYFLPDLYRAMLEMEYIDLSAERKARIEAILDRPEWVDEWGVIDDDGVEPSPQTDEESDQEYRRRIDQETAARLQVKSSQHRAESCDPQTCPFAH